MKEQATYIEELETEKKHMVDEVEALKISQKKTSELLTRSQEENSRLTFQLAQLTANFDKVNKELVSWINRCAKIDIYFFLSFHFLFIPLPPQIVCFFFRLFAFIQNIFTFFYVKLSITNYKCSDARYSDTKYSKKKKYWLTHCGQVAKR